MRNALMMGLARSSRQALPVLILGNLVGCFDEAPSSRAEVVDSAGVSVVSNPPRMLEASESWSLAEAPHVNIGSGPDPATPLFRVTSVLPTGGDRVAVGLASPPQVLLFDRSGNLIYSVGGPGEGPGEFLSVGSVVDLGGDTLGVWDPYRRRLSQFGPRGEHLRDLDLSGDVPESPGGAASAGANAGYTRAVRAGDALVLLAEGAMGPGPESGVYRPELPSRHFTLSGEPVGSYGAFPGMALVAPSGLPQPFGARTYSTMLRDLLVVGSSAVPEYRLISPQGETLRIVRWAHKPPPADGAFASRWSSFLAERPELADMVGSLPRPATIPAHSDIVASDEDLTFVSEYPGPVGLLSLRRSDDAPDALRPIIPVPERRWWVFTAEGEMIASISTPQGFEPQLVIDQAMWGVFESELGIESVRAYRIIRPDASQQALAPDGVELPARATRSRRAS